MTATKATRAAEERVLGLLTQAAERGDPCPSNAQLSERLGFSAPTVSLLVSKLHDCGAILLHRGNSRRVVVITATGKATAGEPPAPHWRDRDPAAPPPPPRPKRTCVRSSVVVTEKRGLATDEIAARVAADQARGRAEREAWLEREQKRYGLARRGRLIDEMPA